MCDNWHRTHLCCLYSHILFLDFVEMARGIRRFVFRVVPDKTHIFFFQLIVGISHSQTIVDHLRDIELY